jgi:riboflavin kinase/FMN adenylyltransferase
MQIIRNRPERSDGNWPGQRTAVAIGNFDGVHRGHRALVSGCRDLVGTGDRIAVLTFEPLPQAFFRPDSAPARLSTVYQKLGLLKALGVDLVWMMRFDHSLASMRASEFAELTLARRLRARHVVLGEDFRFGRGREGDVGLLRQLGEKLDFEVITVPAVTCDGERISSSGIRRRLAAGDFVGAERLLGRPFRMEGHVVRGAGLGRKLGYPTANLAIRAEPSPLNGIFAAWSRISGGPWKPAVTNLGRRPAVGGKEPLLEVHFFDFDEDIYGERLEVQFVAKLRDELDFDSLDALVGQMKRDEAAARECLAQAEAPE